MMNSPSSLSYAFKLIGCLVHVVAGDLSDLKNLENFASSILGNVSPNIQVNRILALHANNKNKINF